MPTHWLTRIYLAYLALFPAAYREEYGEELAYTIRASVADARARGRGGNCVIFQGRCWQRIYHSGRDGP